MLTENSFKKMNHNYESFIKKNSNIMNSSVITSRCRRNKCEELVIFHLCHFCNQYVLILTRQYKQKDL